jgi:uncharacterized membrane protein
MRSAAAALLLILAGCEQKAAQSDMITVDLEGSPTDPPRPAPDHPVAQTKAAPVKPPPVAIPIPQFKALGTEPFWSFEVAPGKLVYSSPEKLDGVPLAARAAPDGKGFRFSATMDGKPVELKIEAGICSDGMSDTVYAYKAEFTWGDQTEQGCARLK